MSLYISANPGSHRESPSEDEAALQLLWEKVLWREEPVETHGDTAQPERLCCPPDLPATKVWSFIEVNYL